MKGRDRKAKARRCGNDMSVTKIRGWPCASAARASAWASTGSGVAEDAPASAAGAGSEAMSSPPPHGHGAAPPAAPRRTIGGPAPPGRRQAIVHAMPTGPFHFTGPPRAAAG